MMDHTERDHGSRPEPGLWKRILPFFRPHRTRIIVSVILMLISAAVDAAVPLFTQYAVDRFAVPGTTEGLGLFTVVYLVLVAIQTATTVIYSRLCMVMEMHSGQDMRRACFVHLQKMPIGFYSRTSVGYLLARVMSDTEKISGLVSWGMMAVVWHGFYLLGLIASMFIIHPGVALIMLCVLPPVVLVSALFRSNMMAANRAVRQANAAITSFYNEHIHGAKTTKTLVSESADARRFGALTRAMYAHSLRVSRLDAVYLPLVGFLGSMAVAVALCRSGTQVLDGTLDYGVLSAFVSCAICILDPINSLSIMFNEFLQAQVNVERVTDLLAQPEETLSPELVERYGDALAPRRENYPPLRGHIRLEHVWFRYPDAAEDDYVLEDVSLDVPAGSTVALVGETGAGKTTLVNLVCRFFEPSRGAIYVDGVDLRERSPHWVHANLGYVQQDPQLFSGTVAENIRYGSPEATEEDIRRAAALGSADRVCARLENGFDTEVGENGSRLSAGERQLVSFARAIAADPPLFVLDEATSSIDTETEALIQNAIARVLPGRTAFIIAHRLSTIRSADRIVFIRGRGIAESGTHDELMAKRGLYYNLYTSMQLREEEA